MIKDAVHAPEPARVALVTGASGGIGRHLAVGLARAGLAVGLHGRDAERLAATRRDVEQAGGTCAVAAADVTDLADVEAMVASVEAVLGPVDLLVNNAGIIERTEVPVWEADPAEWRAVVEADLVGVFHVVRAVVPGMVERGGGRVVDLSSGAGASDRDVYSAYCAAKAGLFRIGGALHLAGHDRGLRSFELSPGVVETEMTHSMAVHAGRTSWTDPQDVVDLVVAIARGELDAWSGKYLRAGADDVATLRAVAGRGLSADARMLRVRPWGDDDPLA
ncbi:MAG: SDR family oxidoreductase [Actinomycetes bacterium]